MPRGRCSDYGFRVLIAPSFADIFYNNCFKNGILPIRLDDAAVEDLFRRAAKHPQYKLTADLESCRLTDEHGLSLGFEIESFRRHCLLNGLDDIGLTLEHEDKITAFENRREHAGRLRCEGVPRLRLGRFGLVLLGTSIGRGVSMSQTFNREAEPPRQCVPRQSLAARRCTVLAVLFIVAMTAALAGAAEPPKVKVETVFSGLNNPTAIVFRPGTSLGASELFISESGAGQVVRMLPEKPGKPTPVITGFPVGPAPAPLGFQVGPLGIAFLDRVTLAVGSGGQGAGRDVVGIYTLPTGDKTLKFQDGSPPARPDQSRQRQQDRRGILFRYRRDAERDLRRLTRRRFRRMGLASFSDRQCRQGGRPETTHQDEGPRPYRRADGFGRQQARRIGRWRKRRTRQAARQRHLVLQSEG